MIRDRVLAIGAIVLAALALSGRSRAQDCTLDGVIKGWDQSPVWGDADYPDVSSDGSRIVFDSVASNLIPGDTNGKNDVWVLDLTSGTITLASVSSSGIQANDHSSNAVISKDNRFVAFGSGATNLDPGDTDSVPDVYLHDLQTGATTLVSRRLGTGSSYWGVTPPCISGDGRFVAYVCGDDNVIPGDTNHLWDVFVYDRVLDRTELVSLGPGNIPADGNSRHPSISADGRFVAFECDANNWWPKKSTYHAGIYLRDRLLGITVPLSTLPSGLVVHGLSPSISEDGNFVAFLSGEPRIYPGHPAGWQDVFVLDRSTGDLDYVSPDLAGTSTHHSENPDISAHGRFVVWDSYADDIVVQPGGTPGQRKVFLHDRATGTTSLVSQTPEGLFPNGSSVDARVSGDGRVVTFWSFASDMVPDTPIYTWHVFWRACDTTTPQVYCAAPPSSLGCRPRLRGAGTPSASAGSGFDLIVEEARSGVVGSIAYGLSGSQGVPVAGGWLCVAPPLRRLAPLSTGGSTPAACDGAFAFDFDAWIASGADPALVAGSVVHAQAWLRDPRVPGGVTLTDAVAFEIGP